MKLEESSIDNILENLLKRSPNQYDTYQDTVAEILNDVKENGDKALFAYTEKFDKAVITKDTIKVTEEEIKEAYDQVDDSLIEVMKKSLANIRDFHEKQLRNSWFETREDGVISESYRISTLCFSALHKAFCKNCRVEFRQINPRLTVFIGQDEGFWKFIGRFNDASVFLRALQKFPRAFGP